MKILNCRNCGDKKIEKLFSLGDLCYSGFFPKNKTINVQRKNLTLVKCKSCHLVQLNEKFNPKKLYNMSYGYRTGINKTMTNHVKQIVKETSKLISEALNDKKDDPMVRQKVAVIERDMRYFAARIESAILTNPKEEDPSHVLFGTKVTAEDEEGDLLTFEIVGEDEANIHEGRVSYLSPLAEALLGGAIGDEVLWEKPLGNSYLTIQKISY